MPIALKDASGRVLHRVARDTLNCLVISCRDLRGSDLSARAFFPQADQHEQPLFNVWFDQPLAILTRE
jgi:hypothetical protein